MTSPSPGHRVPGRTALVINPPEGSWRRDDGGGLNGFNAGFMGSKSQK